MGQPPSDLVEATLISVYGCAVQVCYLCYGAFNVTVAQLQNLAARDQPFLHDCGFHRTPSLLARSFLIPSTLNHKPFEEERGGELNNFALPVFTQHVVFRASIRCYVSDFPNAKEV